MIDILTQYWQQYLWTDGYITTGAAITLWLLVLSALCGGLLSLPLALARVSRIGWLSYAARAYIFVVRGTPLYVQLLIIYTGIYSISWVNSTPQLASFFRSGLNCTILALSLNTAAYLGEILSGAILSLPHGEIEAAQAFGMSPRTIYLHIILPSAIRRSIPLYSNEIIILLQTTSLAFTATVPDILSVARLVNTDTYNSFFAFGIAGVIYACISFLLVWLFKRMEKRWMAFVA